MYTALSYNEWTGCKKLQNRQNKSTVILLLGVLSSFLTVLKNRNTIICLWIFRKHAMFTCFFSSEKQCYSQLFYFKICVLCQNVCLNFGLCDSIHCQFTQCYFNIECQMVENTAYCSHAIQQTNWVTDLGSTLKINVYGIPYKIKPRSHQEQLL